MKINRLFIATLCLLILLLTACNDNEDALDLQNNNGNDDTISSITTNTSSEDYPETKPVKIEDGKYKFVKLENNGGDQQQQQQQHQPQPPVQAQSEIQLNDFEATVVKLTNAERTKRGLSALQVDMPLSNVARQKSKDMQEKGYFSHTSPTYGSPFDMMRDFGITYQSAGENIAHGQPSPQDVVDAWMHSEGHRANILNSEYTHIGVGYVANGNYWTQEFIQKKDTQ